jgi:hypothetical protein
MNKIGLTRVIFLSLLLGQVPAVIADFEIDLSKYEEGDIPTNLLGEGIVIKTESRSNGDKVNYVSGQSSKSVGKINVALTKLSNSFEIIVEANLFLEKYDNSVANKILLLSDKEEQQVEMSIHYNHKVKLGSNADVRLDETAWKFEKINSIKIKINGKLAKLYFNGEFVQSSSVDDNVTYTALQINGLTKKNRIFEIKGKGSSSSTPTNDSTTTASGDCMATYSSNGQLHIPCVTAPNKSGGTSVYDITMQKQSSGFVFNVDMNSIKPR